MSLDYHPVKNKRQPCNGNQKWAYHIFGRQTVFVTKIKNIQMYIQ